MKYVLYMFSLMACAVASLFLYVAWNKTNSAIHEIAAFVIYGVGAVFLVGGSIVAAMTSKPHKPQRMTRGAMRPHKLTRRQWAAVDALEEMS